MKICFEACKELVENGLYGKNVFAVLSIKTKPQEYLKKEISLNFSSPHMVRLSVLFSLKKPRRSCYIPDNSFTDIFSLAGNRCHI